MKFIPLILFITWFVSNQQNFNSGVESYRNAKYAEAIQHFANFKNDEPRFESFTSFNIAHSNFFQDSFKVAQNIYSNLLSTLPKIQKSEAYNNLGIIVAKEPKKDEEALQYFKNAILENPDNEEARYNYELLKKRIQQQQNQQNPEDNKDNQKDEKDKDDKNKDKDKPQNNNNKPQNNNKETPQNAKGEQLSEAEAEKLLQAIKQNEKQFIQQLRKNNSKNKSSYSNSDW